jgi:hypothetical protein
MRSFIICTLHEILLGDQTKKYELRRGGGWGAFCTHGSDEKCSPEEAWRYNRRYLDSIRVDLEAMLFEGVDGISLTQDRVQWRALVNLRVP